MPEIPEGATKPTDHQPKMSDLLAAEAQQPEGVDLLRDPLGVEFWEEADLSAALAGIRGRGETVELTRANLRVIGQIGQLMQETFAVDSSAFRKWLRRGDIAEQAIRLINLAAYYLAALGEAASSES